MSLLGEAGSVTGPKILEPPNVEGKLAKSSKVTAVYGVVADDYLPENNPQVAIRNADSKRGRRISLPSRELPGVFYFVGLPVFVVIFFRIFVMFLAPEEPS